jgi:hypothetical protein
MRIPFPALYYSIYILMNLFQLLILKNKTPLSSFWDRATNFYEGKGDGSWIWITTVLQLSLPDQLIFYF